MKRLFASLLLLATLAAAPAFRLALPGYQWHFPQDDFAHPAFANEWWYFTGNLAAANGHRYGFELTFFRISPTPDLDLGHDLYFTHFAVTDITGRHFAARERARRGDWGQAGAAPTISGFRLWNENWQAAFGPSGPRHLSAAWDGSSLDLDLVPDARMLNGVNGWSQKGDRPGQASYYYSFPRMAAQGQIDGAAVQGEVWMDHEFASNQLASNQQGWDWMGLQFPGLDLMLFNLRRTDGSRDPHSAGTLRAGNMTASLGPADFHMTPTRWWQGYPVAWSVHVPSRQLDFTVTAALDGQLVRAPATGVTYWEGAVVVDGTQAGRSLHGVGYLELTGYGARFNLLQ